MSFKRRVAIAAALRSRWSMGCVAAAEQLDGIWLVWFHEADYRVYVGALHESRG